MSKVKNVCLMCDNYNAEVECDNKSKCALKAMERENERLKKKLYSEKSYRGEPTVSTIGDVHNMGAW